jgi:hypothetical protein
MSKITWSILCPECKHITNHKDWKDGGNLHWTDEFGKSQCPVCGISTAEDLLLVKKHSEITVKKVDYLEYKLKFEIQNLEKELLNKKEHLERILKLKEA